MHIDAKNLEDKAILEADICIVGSGAAGISIALDWDGRAEKVILLEGGGFEYEDPFQNLNAGTTSGQKYYPLKSSRLRYFGGTTGHWAGMCAPFDEIDFMPREWVPHSGWPITREELDPYYGKANKTLQLGPNDYTFEYWRKELENLNPFPFDDQILWNKMWQYTQTQMGPTYKEQIENSKNITLYTHANVTNIQTNEGVNTAESVEIRSLDGKTQTVRAKHIILACGAIQNARLLLASNQQATNGLGNDNDLVGRYFMEHLEISCAELWLSKPFPTDLYSWNYGVTKASAEIGLTLEAQKEHQILNGTASLFPLRIAQHQKPRMEIWQDDDPRKAAEAMFENWGTAQQKAAAENKGAIARAFQLNVRIEQAPNPNSRVTLGTEKDALGTPRPNLNWELTDLDKRSLRKTFLIIANEVGRSGIGRVRLEDFLWDEQDMSWPEGTNGGWHHMGTTRMHSDPQQGVVDANCQVHGIQNLYVAGSGCYATSGAPNPTLTLVALSLRLSDHIKSQLT